MQDFAAKRTALFACLDDASKELKGTILDQGDKPIAAKKRTRSSCSLTDRNNPISSDRSLSFMRGKESIFKKPERPITKCLKARQTPDYQVNPHKWKKYSLSDVDISDHTNTTAAFAFLREMDEQRDAGYESQSSDILPSGREKKIEFKMSSKISKDLRKIEAEELADVEVDKPKLKGSKLVMPEYVVGQQRKSSSEKKKNKKTLKNTGETVRGTLKLSHLQEDVDDDGHDNDDEEEDIVGER